MLFSGDINNNKNIECQIHRYYFMYRMVFVKFINFPRKWIIDWLSKWVRSKLLQYQMVLFVLVWFSHIHVCVLSCHFISSNAVAWLLISSHRATIKLVWSVKWENSRWFLSFYESNQVAINAFIHWNAPNTVCLFNIYDRHSKRNSSSTPTK